MKNRLVKIGCSFLGIYALAYGAYKVVGRSEDNALVAERLYEKWARGDDDKIPAKLQQLMDAQMHIQKKFDPLVAQKSLLQYRQDSCMRTISSFENEAPYHAQFAKTSLLIKDRLYAEALESSYALKKVLEEDASIWNSKGLMAPAGSILYAFNIVRIATLQQLLGNGHAEIATWALLDNTQLSTYHPEARMLLEKAFGEQGCTLSDYIAHRSLLKG